MMIGNRIHTNNEYERRSAAVSLNKRNAIISLSRKGYGKTHFVRVPIKKGEIVFQCYGSPLKNQTSHYSIQIGNNQHILPGHWTGRFLNHSCKPCTYARSNGDGFIELVALRKLEVGEEITYAYWMTEFEWIESADELTLPCLCMSHGCKGRIRSFSQLSASEKRKVQKSGHCSDHLLKI